MSMFGGIIAGAAQGVGQAAGQIADQNTDLYNKQALMQAKSDIGLQKDMALAKFTYAQQQQRIAQAMQMAGYGNTDASQSGVVVPSAVATDGTPIAAGVGATPIAGVNGGTSGVAGASSAAGAPAVQGAQTQSNGSVTGNFDPKKTYLTGLALMLSGVPGGEAMMKTGIDHDPDLAAKMPTDITKLMVQAGVDPNSATGKSILAGAIQKANYIAPASGRPGGFLQDANGNLKFLPHVPEGYQPVQGANGQWNIVPINGATEALRNSAIATAGGKSAVTPITAYDKDGNPVFTNALDAATGGKQQSALPAGLNPALASAVLATESNPNVPNAVSSKGAQGPMQVMPATQTNPGFGVRPAADSSPQELQRVGNDYLGALNQKYGDPTLTAIAYNMGPGATDKWLAAGGDYSKLPAETKNYVGSVMTKYAVNQQGQQGQQQQASSQDVLRPAPALGVEKSVAGTVDSMNSNYDGLVKTNSGAPQDINALNHIKQYAPGAITGAEADKRAYINGLQALIGLNGSEDAKTKTDLLNKNASRIVGNTNSSVGQVTDALRTIAEAANPNVHMNVGAINAAVDQLISIKTMNLDLQKALDPLKLSNDAKGYQTTLLAFNRLADPALWQYKNMTDPAQRKAFLSQAIQEDPTFIQRAQKLHEMGAY